MNAVFVGFFKNLSVIFSLYLSPLSRGSELLPTSHSCSWCRITFSGGSEESLPHGDSRSSPVQSQDHGGFGPGPGHRLTLNAASRLVPELTTCHSPAGVSPVFVSISFSPGAGVTHRQLGVVPPLSWTALHPDSKLPDPEYSEPASGCSSALFYFWFWGRFTLVLSLDLLLSVSLLRAICCCHRSEACRGFEGEPYCATLT